MQGNEGPQPPRQPQEGVRVQKVLQAGTYEAVLDNVELKNTKDGRRIMWSFRIPSENDVVVVGWTVIRSQHKGTPKWFSSHNRVKSYQWVAAIMDKPPTGTTWRPKDVIGGKCRVVLGT